MAGYNPFRTFRKHQKVALAILGVGTMISFIILPALMQAFSSFRTEGPSDIAKCRRFGNVNQQTISVLADNRINLGRFYETLFYSLIAPDGSNMAELRPLAGLAESYLGRVSQEGLVDNWLLCHYATDKGIHIDTETVTNFLNQITAGRLTDKIYKDVLAKTGLNHGYLDVLISQDILSRQMMTAFAIPMSPVPPSSRWNWFQRLNRKITVEVAALPVDRFLSEVPKPADAVLRKFFQDNKDNLDDPVRPEAGFTVLNQAAFQYVKAVPSQAFLHSIPMTEVEQYYHTNKESMFRKPVSPLNKPEQNPTSNIFRQSLGGSLGPSLGGTMPSGPAFPGPSTKILPQIGTIISLDKESKSEEAKPEEIKSEDIKPAEEKSEETKPEEIKDEEAKPEGDKAEEDKSETPADDKQTGLPRVHTRFVSFQVEKESEEASASPVQSNQPESPPEPKKDDVDDVVDLSILYRPLSEVEGEIRMALAQKKTEDALDRIMGQMREYTKVYYFHRDQERTAPPMPDLRPLVEKEGLILESVALGNYYAGAKSEFARGQKAREYLSSIYGEMPILFEPNTFQGDEGKVLLWITESVPQHKPTRFEDVRETVLKRWQEVEARTPAMKRAEYLVAEAKASEKSLAETFASQSDIKLVVETEPFTWMTYGHGVHPLMAIMQQRFPMIDFVREKGVAVGDAEIDNKVIFAADKDFMAVVYDLPVGGIGAAFNHPQNTVYIVRVTGSSPSQESLMEKFRGSYFEEYARAGLFEVRQEAMEQWMKKIREEVGFRWVKGARYRLDD